MATLPDGTTVNQQISEPWDVSPISGVSKVYTEGWDAVLLQMSTFTLNDTPESVTAGDSVTFTGTALRSDGLPASVDIVVELPDGTTETKTAAVGTDGSFEATYTTSQGGTHKARGINDTVGLRMTEGWESN